MKKSPFSSDTGLSSAAREALTSRIVPNLAQQAIAGLKREGQLSDDESEKYQRRESGIISERLNEAIERSREVYKEHVPYLERIKITETWYSTSEMQALFAYYEAVGMDPEIIVSVKNLPLSDWHSIYKNIAINQPDNAPGLLNKTSSDGVGLYFASSSMATDIYKRANPDQGSLVWEITVIPTKSSCIAAYVSHDLEIKGLEKHDRNDRVIDRDSTAFDLQQTAITMATGHPLTVNNHPSIGAMLTYYASRLIHREVIPESIYFWCSESNGSHALNIGYNLVNCQIIVGWLDVNVSYGHLSICASVGRAISG